jgi:hypothetical protein
VLVRVVALGGGGMPRPRSISSIVSQPSTSGWKPYAGSAIVAESRISHAACPGWSNTNADTREWYASSLTNRLPSRLTTMPFSVSSGG